MTVKPNLLGKNSVSQYDTKHLKNSHGDWRWMIHGPRRHHRHIIISNSISKKGVPLDQQGRDKHFSEREEVTEFNRRKNF